VRGFCVFIGFWGEELFFFFFGGGVFFFFFFAGGGMYFFFFFFFKGFRPFCFASGRVSGEGFSFGGSFWKGFFLELLIYVQVVGGVFIGFLCRRCLFFLVGWCAWGAPGLGLYFFLSSVVG